MSWGTGGVADGGKAGAEEVEGEGRAPGVGHVVVRHVVEPAVVGDVFLDRRLVVVAAHHVPALASQVDRQDPCTQRTRTRAHAHTRTRTHAHTHTRTRAHDEQQLMNRREMRCGSVWERHLCRSLARVGAGKAAAGRKRGGWRGGRRWATRRRRWWHCSPAPSPPSSAPKKQNNISKINLSIVN
jgi:hypothetical protein